MTGKVVRRVFLQSKSLSESGKREYFSQKNSKRYAKKKIILYISCDFGYIIVIRTKNKGKI